VQINSHSAEPLWNLQRHFMRQPKGNDFVTSNDLGSLTDWYGLHRSVPQQLITHLAYGQAADGDYIRLANKIKADTTEALQPGRWLINLFPTCTFMPIRLNQCYFALSEQRRSKICTCLGARRRFQTVGRRGASRFFTHGADTFLWSKRKICKPCLQRSSIFVNFNSQEHGVAPYSFVRECLEQLPAEYSPMEENIIMSAAASLFTGNYVLLFDVSNSC